MYWTDAALNVGWLEQRSTSPYPVPLACGCCHGFRRNFFHEIGAYDSGMIGYGSEDLEICLRTWVLGYQVVVVPEVDVFHLFRSHSPYERNWEENTYNLLRMVYMHFNTERINRILPRIMHLPSFEGAVHHLNTSDVWTKRRMLELKRRHDDDWFCTMFGLDI
jgi:GT2 family glycosyltransferase